MLWQILRDSQKSNSTLDAEDKRVLDAGLLFDDLLSYLRQGIRLSEIDLKQSAIARFAIAIATLNLYQINEQTQIAKPKPEHRGFFPALEDGRSSRRAGVLA